MKIVLALGVCFIILFAQSTPHDTFSDEKAGFEQNEQSEAGYFGKEGDAIQGEMRMHSEDTAQQLEGSPPEGYPVDRYNGSNGNSQ